MKAIILAAGRGSRLGAMTDDCPKGMVPLLGKPLLQWQVDALKGAGIHDIGIVSGYMAKKINLSVTAYFENLRWQETNMVMSLVCAAEWLERYTCIISYSDIIYRVETATIIASAAGDITITYDPNWRKLWEERFDNPLEDAETFKINESGRLLKIGAKAESMDDIQGQYMGLLKFTPEGWRIISSYLDELTRKQRDKLDMTALLSGLLDKGVEIQAFPINERWFELDNETDFEIIKKYFERRSHINAFSGHQRA